MAFDVHFTAGASNDLRALHSYIANNDSVENADYVAREIVRAALTLRECPKGGTHPSELLKRGSRS
jgi:plasmid stabilization system protein ParE